MATDKITTAVVHPTQSQEYNYEAIEKVVAETLKNETGKLLAYDLLEKLENWKAKALAAQETSAVLTA